MKVYTKRATSYNQQIDLLRRRGIIIEDEEFAKDCLRDIGYYRLGFYIYPFEMSYPNLGKKREHEVRPGTKLEEIIAFYYYNFDLRNILNRYLSRIEIHIRTALVYELSNKYGDNPYWYVDKEIVEESFIADFKKKVYDTNIRMKAPIMRHHTKYYGRFAPAWKTMEYMTLGNLETLYSALRSSKDQCQVSMLYGEPSGKVFRNYISVLREVRNSCAHSNVIVGMNLQFPIMRGSACPTLPVDMQNTFNGALRVIRYLLKRVSSRQELKMMEDLEAATQKLLEKAPSMRGVVETKTGIVV